MFQYSFSKIKKKSLDVVVCQGFIYLFKWCHRESNQGHTDFQSVALPTELWHLLFGLQIYISISFKQNFISKKSSWISDAYVVHLQPDQNSAWKPLLHELDNCRRLIHLRTNRIAPHRGLIINISSLGEKLHKHFMVQSGCFALVQRD